MINDSGKGLATRAERRTAMTLARIRALAVR